MKYSATVIESQVDWLSFTAPYTLAQFPLVEAINRWADLERELPAKQRHFSLHGYEGMAVGRVRWGVTADKLLCQLSGQVAEDRLVAALEHGVKVTRLDLAVTTRHDPWERDVAADTYREYQARNLRGATAAKAKLILNSAGGQTVYVGERDSERCLRVYDKGAESGEQHYENCWRAELELKGVLAVQVAHQVEVAPNRAASVQSYLFQQLRVLGIKPWFPDTGAAVLEHGFRRRTDALTRLVWLQTSVQPALRWLVEVGFRKEALEALDLHLAPGEEWDE